MLTAETILFAIIMVGIGLFIMRRPIWRIYPTEGYYAGNLQGRRKQIYQSLWFIAAAVSLLWRPWLAYSLIALLLMLFPFFLRRDDGPTWRSRR